MFLNHVHWTHFSLLSLSRLRGRLQSSMLCAKESSGSVLLATRTPSESGTAYLRSKARDQRPKAKGLGRFGAFGCRGSGSMSCGATSKRSFRHISTDIFTSQNDIITVFISSSISSCLHVYMLIGSYVHGSICVAPWPASLRALHRSPPRRWWPSAVDGRTLVEPR